MPTYKYIGGTGLPNDNFIFGNHVSLGQDFELEIYLTAKIMQGLGVSFVKDDPYVSPVIGVINADGKATTDEAMSITVPDIHYSFDIKLSLLTDCNVGVYFNGDTSDDNALRFSGKGVHEVLRYTSGRKIRTVEVKVLEGTATYCLYLQRLENCGVPADMRGV